MQQMACDSSSKMQHIARKTAPDWKTKRMLENHKKQKPNMEWSLARGLEGFGSQFW